MDLQPACPRNWSLSTPHGIYVTFQMAEVAVPRQMFAEILRPCRLGGGNLKVA